MISKEERIEAELQRLNELFKNADSNEKAMAAPLFQNAAFMAATLQDLQETINKEGVVEKYQNGENQYGYKQSAALQSFNALVKNYNSVMKELFRMLPPGERPREVPFHIKFQLEREAAERGIDFEAVAEEWRKQVAESEKQYLEEQAE